MVSEVVFVAVARNGGRSKVRGFVHISKIANFDQRALDRTKILAEKTLGFFAENAHELYVVFTEWNKIIVAPHTARRPADIQPHPWYE